MQHGCLLVWLLEINRRNNSLSLLFFSPLLRVQIDALIEHYIVTIYMHQCLSFWHGCVTTDIVSSSHNKQKNKDVHNTMTTDENITSCPVSMSKDCNRKDPAMWAAPAPYLKSTTAFHLLNCPNPAHNNMTRRDAFGLGRKCCPLVSACTLFRQTVELHSPADDISQKISHFWTQSKIPVLNTQANSTFCLCYFCQFLWFFFSIKILFSCIKPNPTQCVSVIPCLSLSEEPAYMHA